MGCCFTYSVSCRGVDYVEENEAGELSSLLLMVMLLDDMTLRLLN
jgi:hypothetical protein